MTKDYYKILGVTEFDTAENIKAAYRKLARKWHPDIAGNTEDVMLKFKEINEAYEILSNQIKKGEYDKARRFYNYAKQDSYYNETKKTEESSFKNTTNTFNKKNENFFNWKEFFEKTVQSQNKNKEPKVARNGQDLIADLEITTFEAVNGVSKTINVLQIEICPKCNGKKFVNGTSCKHCDGKGEKTNYKKFTVKVPAGVKNGSKIRLSGEGNLGINGGKNGDLYIKIHVKEEKFQQLDGLNIKKIIPITPSEAVLGANVSINTINGNINLKIPENTQNGQKFRLAGCGIVQNEKVGDMIVTVEIKIPNSLTREEIDLYKKLSEISTSSIRDSLDF